MWYTWNGGHLWGLVPVPWGHVILPDAIIMRVIDRHKLSGSNEQYIQYKKEQYETLARLTISRLQEEVGKSGLNLISFENKSNNRIKNALANVPVLNEVFAGTIRVTLEKPA